MQTARLRILLARCALAQVVVAGLLTGGCQALPSSLHGAGPTPAPAVASVPQIAATVPARARVSTRMVTPAAQSVASVTPARVTAGPDATSGPEPVATRSVEPGVRHAPLPATKTISQTENILLLGTDTRSNLTVWNTDSIIVLAVDRDAGQVGVISIPRDLLVDIPGWGEDRINVADYAGEKTGYPGGGPALAQRTLELATGIPTQHYVTFEQDGLIRLVDALGGVTVVLDCPLYEMAPDPKQPDALQTFELPAGPVLLDGATAKKFVTFRYVESDFGRQRRQQQLVWALRNRALQGDVLTHIPQLLGALNGMFTTDLSVPEIIGLASFGARLKPTDIHLANVGPELYEEYTTELGAWVLLLKDRAAFHDRLGELFSARPLSQAGQPVAGNCPPPPPGFNDLAPSGPSPTPPRASP